MITCLCLEPRGEEFLTMRKANAAASNSRQVKKLKAETDHNGESPIFGIDTRAKWKISFKTALFNAVKAREADPDAPLDELIALARTWTSASTGPEEEKLLFEIDQGHHYGWWQRKCEDDYDLEEEKEKETIMEDLSRPCVGSLHGSDKTFVRILNSIRDESGLPLFSVTLGRIHKHEEGKAGHNSEEDSEDDGGTWDRSGGYYREIQSKALYMDEAESADFSFSWVDGSKAGDHLTLVRQLIPRSDVDLRDWININPDRGYTKVVMDEIMADWFPSEPFWGSGDAQYDNRQRLKGTYSQTLACPVIVVHPFSLLNQICGPKEVISQYAYLAREATTPSAAQHLLALAVEGVQSLIDHQDVSFYLEDICVVDPSRCLDLIKQYITNSHSPLISGKNIPSLIHIIETVGWNTISKEVLEAVDSAEAHFTAVQKLANGLSQDASLEVTTRVLKKICDSPSILPGGSDDYGHSYFHRPAPKNLCDYMVTLFRNSIYHSSLNPFFSEVVQSIRKCESRSSLVPLMNKYVIKTYRLLKDEVKSNPHIKGAFSNGLTPYRAIAEAELIEVLEVLLAVDGVGNFKSFMANAKPVFVNSMFVNICSKHFDCLDEPAISEALQACTDIMKEPSWEWITPDTPAFVRTLVRVVFLRPTLHPCVNAAYKNLVHSVVHKGGSAFIRLLISNIHSALKSVSPHLKGYPNFQQTFFETIIPCKSIGASDLVLVLELLKAFGKVSKFKAYLDASVNGRTGDQQHHRLVNDTFVTICKTYPQGLQKKGIAQALKVCEERMSDPAWKWDVMDKATLVKYVVQVGLKTSSSLFDSYSQRGLVDFLTKTPQTPRNKEQLMSLKSKISIMRLISERPPVPKQQSSYSSHYNYHSWNRDPPKEEPKQPLPLEVAISFFVRLCKDQDEVTMERVCSELISISTSHKPVSEMSTKIYNFCKQKEVLDQVGTNVNVTRLLRTMVERILNWVPFDNKYPDAVAPKYPRIEQFLRSQEKRESFNFPSFINVVKYRDLAAEMGGVASSKNEGKMKIGTDGHHILSYSITGAGKTCTITFTKDNGNEKDVWEKLGSLKELATSWKDLLTSHQCYCADGENKGDDSSPSQGSSTVPLEKPGGKSDAVDIDMDLELPFATENRSGPSQPASSSLPPKNNKVDDVIDLT